MSGLQWFGVALIVIGVFFIMCAALLFYLQYVFDRRPEQTGKAFGYRMGAKQKNDVTIYGRRWSSPLHIRHLTKAVYRYTVEEKVYKIRHEHIGTRKETPRTVPIVYWKRFPRFSYVAEYQSSPLYSLWGGVLLFFGGMSLWMDITHLFG